MFGAIEAGGTKFVCAVGTGPEDLRRVQFATGPPRQTVATALEFFRSCSGLQAVGIGSFGPVDLNPASPTYGYVTSTPKPGWANYDFAGAIGGALNVPVGFDTDVNAAALGEFRWGAAQGLPDFMYLTVGTGIGGGAMVNGRILHGLLHPEMGHISVPHDRAEDPFPGACPYHRDCLEGLASGPAMEARWGMPARQLPPDHPGWDLEARYLARGLATWVCTLSPRRIILGGGVMQHPRLIECVRLHLRDFLNGYVQVRELADSLDRYVIPPGLGPRSGVLGALALAGLALERKSA